MSSPGICLYSDPYEAGKRIPSLDPDPYALDPDRHSVDTRRIRGCSHIQVFEHLLCRQRFRRPSRGKLRLRTHGTSTRND